MSGLRRALEALEKGNWVDAHRLVQDETSPEAAWVHAHLHRVEGDLANAGYWYRQAGRPAATESLDAERQSIIDTLRE